MWKLILFFIGALFTVTCMAQSVSINTDGSTANASAILDVKSTTKGMLVPRMSKTEKNTIASPATGLLVFQNAPDSIGFHYYDGLAWIWLEVLGNAGWKTTGNAGTDTAINFIGTTDNMPLRFRQNNIKIAEWNRNKRNYFIGVGAGNSAGIANGQISIGDSTGPNFNGTTASGVLIGTFAGKSLTNGFNPVMIGLRAGESNTSGGGNVFVGTVAGRFNTTGAGNTYVGHFAADSGTIGSNNTAIGLIALSTNKKGSLNTAIGVAADVGNDSLVNVTAIGAQSRVDTSNALVLGSINAVNGATANVNVAIGTTKPRSALHVSRGSSGNTVTVPSNRISLFEDNSANYIQLLSPDANETGILAGNASTLIKSGIVFAADSAVLIRTGGNNTRIFAAKTGLVGIGNTSPQGRLHVSNGTTLGAAYIIPATGIFESSTLNYFQLMNPSTTSASILSGTELTSSRSSINFNPDSSIAFNSPGFTSRMTVKNDGDVLIPGLLGVGNNVPQTKLHVSRGIVAGAAYNTTSTGIFESSTFNSIQLMNPSTTSASILSGTELTSSRSSINFNADSSIAFNAPGFTSRMTVKNDGNVLIPGLLGIGNNVPQTKLHVSRGTVAGAAYNTSATGIIESSNFNSFQLMNPSTAVASIVSGTELTSSRSSINFNVDSSIAFNSPGFASRMTIKNDGDVLIPGLLGIGNTSPQTKFHVSRGTVAGAAYNPSATGIIESSSFNSLQLMNPSTAGASIVSGTELTTSRSSINFNADSSLSFVTGGFTTRLTILRNGNTGINITNPGATLDANGTFKLGNLGTVNSAIIKNTVTIDVGSVPANNELDVVTPVANVIVTGAVSVSPAATLNTGLIIAWARVSSPGNITIRYRNVTGSAIDPLPASYNIAVIQ